MRARAVVAALIGLGCLAWLAWRAGLGAVLAAVGRLGPAAFLLILGFQFVLFSLAALAWYELGRGRADLTYRAALVGRLIREASSQFLPFTHLGGLALGGRALALEGVEGGFAFASTVLDVTLEFTSQVAYCALGLALLEAVAPGDPLTGPALAVTLALAGMGAGLATARTHGFSALRRLLRRTAGGRFSRFAGRIPNRGFAPLEPPRRRTRAAFGLHFLAWALTGAQTLMILRFLKIPIGLPAAIALDSLTGAAKAAAFLVPGGFGVQEGALVLLGQVLGVPPAAAIALSLVRRGRDLALGLPVLAAWQIRKGDRIWRMGPDAQGVDRASPRDVPAPR